MDSFKLVKEIEDLADKELSKTEQYLPTDIMACRGILVETVRVLDFIKLGQPGVSEEDRIPFSIFDLNMIEMGWNIAASLLLKDGDHRGFPMKQSTDNSRKQMISLMYHLGIISQLRRTVEMIKAGSVKAEKVDTTFIFYLAETSGDQSVDDLELQTLEDLNERLKSSGNIYKQWELVDQGDIADTFWKVGNFIGVERESPFSSWKIENIDDHLLPLINQWDSGNNGIMIAYDSTPEVDHHFLAVATEIAKEWQNEAGIHPDTEIGSITATQLVLVVSMITSFHLKHIRFTQLAAREKPEILIPQSVSIWTYTHDLINDMADYSGMDKKVIAEALDMITLKPTDTDFLRTYTARFKPLLIDIGSGFVLRPSSCILHNPLHAVYALLISRNPGLRDKISEARENWLRNYLYALLAGTRYQQVKGNIKIRKCGNIVTDVDAAIYDNLTGELALVQIKWQDYFTNDVKKLRSRAKNFVTEINKWAAKVYEWIDSTDLPTIVSSFKLKGASGTLDKSKIYLFGLSKNAARMSGYGYDLKNDRIAVGTWPQFVRNRTEIGPAPNVISELFKQLKAEESAKIDTRPMPVEVPFAGATLNFKDIWRVFGEEDNKKPRKSAPD